MRRNEEGHENTLCDESYVGHKEVENSYLSDGKENVKGESVLLV